VVPKLIGIHNVDGNVSNRLRKHDCRLGDTTNNEYGEGTKKDRQVEHGWEKGVVISQSLKKKTVHPQGTKVNITAEY
jgi:hypothetical protein